MLLSYFGRIIQECRVLLSDLKDKGVVLRFVKRSKNNVAHFLAGYYFLLADRVYGGEKQPKYFVKWIIAKLMINMVVNVMFKY